jgi:predicted esterase YcpF (UPF0227 family)
MKKALYIHGAFSAFKPLSEKVIALEKEFNIVGFNYCMETSFDDNISNLEKFCIEQKVDFIIGVSLGGLYASHLAHRLMLPSVLINPCVDPSGTLHIIIGEYTNYTTGKNETFTQSLADTFPSEHLINDNSLIFVGLKDDVINPHKTVEIASLAGAKVISNEQADHYWELFQENNTIKNFVEK